MGYLDNLGTSASSLLQAILGNNLGNDNASQQQPSQGQGLLATSAPANYGLLSPQGQSFDQYNQDRHSARGILAGLLANGIGPGLAQAVAPDSFSIPGFNAQIGQGIDTYLKSLTVPKAKTIAGVFNGDIDPSTGLPIQGQAAPTMPGQAAPQPSGLLPGPGLQPQGTPSPIGSAPPSAPAPATSDTAAPVNRLFGIPTPGNVPANSAFLSSQLTPDLFKAYAAGQNEAVRPGGYAPNPQGVRQFYPAGIPGVAVPPSDPSFNQQAAAFTRQQEDIKQGARVGAERSISGNKFALDTGEADPTGGTTQVGGGFSAGPKLATGAPSASALAKEGQTTPQAAAFNGQSFQTGRGTVVPAPKGNQVMGPGAEQIKGQIENSQKTEANWDAIRPTLESARDRLTLSSQIFSQLEGKGLNEQKALAANTLRGAGLNWFADKVMSSTDTAGVQTAVWNSMQEALSSLKAINSGTGGRILNSEFNAFMEHGYSPDMVGPTLHTAITHQLGQIYQTQNMIDDFGTARQMNWRDASQYQRAYLKSNPVEGFVKYATAATPPFKGMPEAAAAPKKWKIVKGQLVPE